MNKMGERGHLKAELAQLLGGPLPAVFLGGAPKILRPEVADELVARYPHLEDELRAWLRRWTRSSPYLRKLSFARWYHDLDGNRTEPVATATQLWAREQMSARIAARRKARSHQTRRAA